MCFIWVFEQLAIRIWMRDNHISNLIEAGYSLTILEQGTGHMSRKQKMMEQRGEILRNELDLEGTSLSLEQNFRGLWDENKGKARDPHRQKSLDHCFPLEVWSAALPWAMLGHSSSVPEFHSSHLWCFGYCSLVGPPESTGLGGDRLHFPSAPN